MALAHDATAGPTPWLSRVFDAQRGRLFYWAPVCLGIGCGIYFGSRAEPALAAYAAILAGVGLLALLARSIPAELRVLPTALGLVLIGVLLAGARAHSVAGPVLGFRYYGPIEGRVVAVDRSQSDKPRLTLDRVQLKRMAPSRTPQKVRVSLHGPVHFVPEPGLRVMVAGHLSPPQGPVEPGGFDFRRMAWFQGLGAVGYARGPALVSAPAEEGRAGLWVHRIRMAISTYVQQALPGRTGAFAAAVTTGDRSAMDKPTLEALRITNLAHLLAISGLHMGLLTGFVFGALRVGLALIRPVALRWPTKKIAAFGALAAGGFYYALSGGNVATERAFIMVSVMLIAVLFDRRAITLRAVAIAALIVLALRPETIVSPGFQMSFAATTALVAVFAAIRGYERAWLPPKLQRWLAPVLALVISSGVAGLATAPVAAAHFNRFADYGLIANLLSVPMMGLVVMPGAVLAAVLSPLGLAWVGLAVMKPGIDWILMVADWVAGMDGASTPVIAPPGWVLPVLALGALWVILWQGRARVLGLVPVCAAFIGWSLAERPPVLVDARGALMGVLGPEGRALSKPKGDGFAALSWLENDGDFTTQEGAYARAGVIETKGELRIELGEAQIALLRGRGVEDRLAAICEEADLVISSKALEAPPGCALYDQLKLRASGALAVWTEQGRLRIVETNTMLGARLWSPR